MNFDVEERKRQLDTFSTFINESYNRIDDMLQSVGWSREFLTNENLDLVSCPLNPEHRMPKKSLDSHVQLCSWRREGYHEHDTPLPENPIENYENTKSSIVIDAQLQAEIIKEAKDKDSSLQTGNMEAGTRLVPKTSDRLTADFTSDERRVLYDFVISKTSPVEDMKLEDLQFIGDMKRDDQPRPKSKLELLIEQRDAKRRRISYKKKVHTNRKSHSEILREVIQNQMDLLEQIIKGECDDEIAGDDKDEIFSLGGDEVNILPTRSKIERKSCREIGSAADISDKERNLNRKVIEKEIGKHGSDPQHGERYNRSEQFSENWIGKPEAYQKYEKNNSERRRWNEGHRSSSSSSMGEKAARDRYFMNDNRGGERSRDHRPCDRDKNRHHRSRTNSEDFEEYRHYSKTLPKQDRSEYRKQHSSHSKRVTYSSKRDSSEVKWEEERETESQTKRYRSSNYSGSERDRKYERKYEANSHKNGASSHKSDNTDKPSQYYDVHSKEFHREDNYDNGKISKEFNDWSSEQREGKFEVENDETSPEARKYSKKLKKSKKKKKNHKHKSKKKYKRRKSNSSRSSSSSQSSSDGSDSNSSY